VKKTEGGQTTVYVNKYYEKNITTAEVTTSYYLGGKLIALRKGTTLSYAMQDHLGSTSATADSSGNSTSIIRYFSFGATRYTTGTLPTDKKFTGQRLDATGLYYYGARYYDASIGRFISPDTIVPDPANPQSLNRYSYCLNNPLKYTDPTGHDSYTGYWMDCAAREGYNVNYYSGSVSSTAASQSYEAALSSYSASKNAEAGGSLPVTHTNNAEVFGVAITAGGATAGASGLTTVTNILTKLGPVGLLAEMFLYLLTIPGDAPNPNMVLNKTIDDFKNNPGDWEKVGEKSEPATNRDFKGGTSVDEKFRNKQTGQEIEKHKIIDRNGKIVHDHFRIPPY
jgi:RHS repeat-associated protein